MRAAPADNAYAGVVESAECLGDRLELVVRSANVPVTVSTRAGQDLRPGREVVLRLAPAATSCLAS
ncbi:TOBE domain-containing protein [Streptomyces sp. NPDC008139]|uniref:TOBE domain-containing protein n=1 Tax=Streptomyces sp. NPDC008139 TaxID=3364814 RepID=UPI0036E6C731